MTLDYLKFKFSTSLCFILSLFSYHWVKVFMNVSYFILFLSLLYFISCNISQNTVWETVMFRNINSKYNQMKINVNNLLNIVTASIASMSEMNVEWFGHWKGRDR